jgi:hypothetical protein
MRRRDLLKAAGASLGALAAPRIGRAERSNKLVFARRLLGSRLARLRRGTLRPSSGLSILEISPVATRV